MIRRAKIPEITDILNITKACANKMIAQGIFQWNENYPSAKAFLKDIERNELFVLEKDAKIIGTIVLSTFMDNEYKPVKWGTQDGANIYIHRLSVDPTFQSKGYAQLLMNFAENFAKEKGYISIRLDTFSQNKRNQKFYEQRNYQRLEAIYYPKQSKYPFHCYELVL